MTQIVNIEFKSLICISKQFMFSNFMSDNTECNADLQVFYIMMEFNTIEF